MNLNNEEFQKLKLLLNSIEKIEKEDKITKIIFKDNVMIESQDNLILSADGYIVKSAKQIHLNSIPMVEFKEFMRNLKSFDSYEMKLKLLNKTIEKLNLDISDEIKTKIIDGELPETILMDKFKESQKPTHCHS